MRPVAPIETTLRTPPRTWGAAERAFVPLQISADTTVAITSPAVAIDLVVTFSPSSPVPNGVLRVAAFQTVYSAVSIDFTTEATLCWMVSALKTGELNPNQAAEVFSSNADTFRLQVTQYLAVTHDPGGWTIPTYDDRDYTVNVGFGLRIRGWVYWAYSVRCTPNQQRLAIPAGSYELVRSDGSEQIGDPVYLAGMSQWVMPMGHAYTLTFDASGNGVLRVAQPLGNLVRADRP